MIANSTAPGELSNTRSVECESCYAQFMFFKKVYFYYQISLTLIMIMIMIMIMIIIVIIIGFLNRDLVAWDGVLDAVLNAY